MARDAADLVNVLKNLETSEITELFDGFCSECQLLLKSRLLSVYNGKVLKQSREVDLSSSYSSNGNNQQCSNHEKTPLNNGLPGHIARLETDTDHVSPSSVNSKPQLRDLFSNLSLSPSVGNSEPSSTVSNGSSEEEEFRRLSQVKRKKDFVHYERVDGKRINVVQGLELHTGVFSAEEQKKIVDCVYNFQRMGRKGELLARTYSEPKKWMRGKGRVTIQFGCCYNYAVDKDGNPPGIIRNQEVDPLPPLFKQMISRMVRWQVLPPTCVPDSCIVNIYDEGDCIPPHIDHHDFIRPFCTVSFLAECNIIFGSNLKILSPGEFSGPVSIPLPVGSVLVLNGNGADVAKHCVPAVPAKRISVTFRKMDDSKLPDHFSLDPDMLNLKPLVRSPLPNASIGVKNQSQVYKNPSEVNKVKESNMFSKSRGTIKSVNSSFTMETDDFPPLGGSKSRKR